MKLLDKIQKEYKVDKTRVYVTGASLGGGGSIYCAAYYPDRVAAIAPMCAGYFPELADRIHNTAAWVFHGALDQMPATSAVQMAKRLGNHNAYVRSTIFPDLGHNVEFVDELFEWFLQFRKEDGHLIRETPDHYLREKIARFREENPFGGTRPVEFSADKEMTLTLPVLNTMPGEWKERFAWDLKDNQRWKVEPEVREETLKQGDQKRR